MYFYVLSGSELLTVRSHNFEIFTIVQETNIFSYLIDIDILNDEELFISPYPGMSGVTYYVTPSNLITINIQVLGVLCEDYECLTPIPNG